ncbi:hypothetical protein [Lysobacter sp. F6437]|uniref:hypothetical protein n=1 Tax=Lysobacter sp. F6437 TaxID=3459296 RepID=UPI00403DCA69
MRPTSLVLIAAITATLLSACGSMEYRDTNAAVDARPECDGSVGRPGELVPAWCERTQEATWSSESDSAGIDFGVGDDD